MTIDISPIESDIYRKHWGYDVEEIRYEGDSLSSPIILNGACRIIVDKVIITEDFYEETTILFPVFEEDCYLIFCGIGTTGGSVQGVVSLTLYENDKRGAVCLNLNLTPYMFVKDPNVSIGNNKGKAGVKANKGNALGIYHIKDEGGPLVDGTFYLTIIYSSTR